MELVRRLATAQKPTSNATTLNNLIQEEVDSRQYFPYTSKEIKDHILELDQDIIQLASDQIADIDKQINHCEKNLDYDELQRVAWAAEIAKDDETLLHIVEMMVEKKQLQNLGTSLNGKVHEYEFTTEQRRLIYTAYEAKVLRLQQSIDFVQAVSEKVSFRKILTPLVNYIKQLVQ